MNLPMYRLELRGPVETTTDHRANRINDCEAESRSVRAGGSISAAQWRLI